MSEEQKSQPQQRKEKRLWETASAPPAEPVNTVPFIKDGDIIQKGLSSPPAEPVNISPFLAKPTQKTSNTASSSESTK
ncbi:MAG: hypothetical protein ABSD92_04305 [Candidatus Bathyarchaeia archaeon]|jgi:hypothetical protein